MTEDTTNLGTEVEPAAEAVTADQAGADDAQPRDDKGRFANKEGDDPESPELPEEEQQPEEETEEIDYEGKRYAVPKSIKEAIMRNADYTRKTQEIAEQRKAIEAAFAKQKEAEENQKADFEEFASLHALKKYIEQFSAIDWNKAMEEDPVAANKQFIELHTLRRQLQDRETKLTQKQQERALQAQREAARREEEGREKLRNTIKGWSPEVESNLKAFAKERGVPNADSLQFALHPQETQILYEAYQYRQLMKKAQAKPKAPDPKPSKTVTQGGRSSPQGLSDDLPMEEWAARWRAKQARK